jgi:ATP-binding cassette, subfamily C, bacterial CydC
MRRLLALARPVRWWIVLAALSSFAALAANVALMTAAPYLISRSALVTEFATVALAVTAVRLFAIARAALRYVERYSVHLAAFRVLTHLRVLFYRAIEPLAPAGLDSDRSGDLMARAVADIDTLDAFYVRGLAPPVAALLTTVVACAILGGLDLRLAVVLFGCLAAGGLAVPWAVRRASRPRASNVIRARAALYADVADDVTGLSDLLVFGAEPTLVRRVDKGSRRMGEGLRRLAFVRGAGRAAGATIAGLAATAVLAIAIPMVHDGSVEGVLLAAVPLVAIAAFEAVQPLGDAYREIELSRAAAARTFEVLDAEPLVRDPATPAAVPEPASLEFRDVGFRYEAGGPAVLEDLSFEISPGEHVAITGPSGAGKTTVTNLLLRFWDAGQGSVRIGGTDVRSYRGEDVRTLFGVVPQRVHLFNGTLRDNLLLADGDADDERIVQACARARLGPFLSSLPDGLDTRVGEDGLTLSGGERQRVALARVFLREAPVVILDEATANLDEETESEVLEAVRSFAEGRTTIVISHRPAALRLADRVVTMTTTTRVTRSPGEG